jgi:hypothetical protein
MTARDQPERTNSDTVIPVAVANSCRTGREELAKVLVAR